MRIGWHVHLFGPFSAGGTVWRSKRRQRGYHGTLPGWKCPHNHSRMDLAVACAQREARRRGTAPAPRQAPRTLVNVDAEIRKAGERRAARAARQQDQDRAQAVETALASAEQLFGEQIAVQGRTLAPADIPAVRKMLDDLDGMIGTALAGRQRRQARDRLSRVRAQLENVMRQGAA